MKKEQTKLHKLLLSYRLLIDIEELQNIMMKIMSVEIPSTEENEVFSSELRRMMYSSTTERQLNLPHVYIVSNLEDSVRRKYLGDLISKRSTTRKDNEECEEHIVNAIAGVSNDDVAEMFRIKIITRDCLTTLEKKILPQEVRALNPIQSAVYGTVSKSNDNVLVCAPTGAGKTNVALLAIIRVISQFLPQIDDFDQRPLSGNQMINKSEKVELEKLKVIYIAPLKALASEITQKFQSRLSVIGVNVRELTGDVHMSKSEIAKTHVIVTTPEKWDVITRRGYQEESMVAQTRLIILDEIHLLRDDRGSALECIVARTLRQIESTQQAIRLIGLSATLPNYIDVARFLHVPIERSLFFFDFCFRPVPLEMSFIGVKDPNCAVVNQTQESSDNVSLPVPSHVNQAIDQIAFDRAVLTLLAGNQVMIFVHSRRATVVTAKTMINLSRLRNNEDLFINKHEYLHSMRRKLFQDDTLKELLEYSMSVHHAGMERKDRRVVEELFSKGVIRLLVCTATLSWGINLPAQTVIIKGTNIYDSSKGKFVNLSILDVQQIFGRAGRPQYDKAGTAILITTHKQFPDYVRALTDKVPIESTMMNSLTDAMNAEICLGTVTNIDEAVSWFGYTFMAVRIKQNPLVYGASWKDLESEEALMLFTKRLIQAGARLLDRAKMIRYHQDTGYLFITEVGRIASHFYLKHLSAQMLNETLSPNLTEPQLLHIMSKCSEFTSLKARTEENEELKQMERHCCRIAVVGGGVDSECGKTNVLIQAYISRYHPYCFSLISDMTYISQNIGRISQAILELAIHKSYSAIAECQWNLVQCINHRLWPGQNPLLQFSHVNTLFPWLYSRLSKSGNSVILNDLDRLIEMQPTEISSILRVNISDAALFANLAKSYPFFSVSASVHPLSRCALRVSIQVTPEFKWCPKLLRTFSSLSFKYWVEYPEQNCFSDSSLTRTKPKILHRILALEHFQISKHQIDSCETINLNSMILLKHTDESALPTQLSVRVFSEQIFGLQAETLVSIEKIKFPENSIRRLTKLLDLNPLPISALTNQQYESYYSDKFPFFNPIQTQVFHSIYFTNCNIFAGAPTGSGKTVIAEIASFRLFSTNPKQKVIYIAPFKALVRERILDWQEKFKNVLNKTVIELSGDSTPSSEVLNSSNVIITTPEKWDGISRAWNIRSLVKKVGLVIFDEVHLLGDDRGPALEAIVARLLHLSRNVNNRIRIVALSTAVSNVEDLAKWLRIPEEGLFNFEPSVRPVPLEVHVSGYPGRHYCPRMAIMNKPTFQAIMTHSPDKPTLIFVSSRRQTRVTGLELISYISTQSNPRMWLKCDCNELEKLVSSVFDEHLAHLLSFGIGIHHAGLKEPDRKLVEKLFRERKIMVLIATSTLAWGVNFPAHLVIVKGTEYYDGQKSQYVDFPLTDLLQMVGRAGRPQFDSCGIAVILTQASKKDFYKKFLYEPFPVESCLLKSLPDHLNAEIASETVKTQLDVKRFLSVTYFYLRIKQNPSYYGVLTDNEEDDKNSINKFLNGLIIDTLNELTKSNCIRFSLEKDYIAPTPFGVIASSYYLNHLTIRYFSFHLNSFATGLHGPISITELLFHLSMAHEYHYLPVRHNEDKYNEQLAGIVPFRLSPTSNMLDPHVKTYLLFQAHLGNIPLPISDYVTDTYSVLDQSARILQAMIDVISENGNFLRQANIDSSIFTDSVSCDGCLSNILQCILLMQCLSRRQMWYEVPVLQLPHVGHFDHDLLGLFHSFSKDYSLAELCQLGSVDFHDLSSKLNQLLPEIHANAILRSILNLPILDVVHRTKNYKIGKQGTSVDLEISISRVKNANDTMPNYLKSMCNCVHWNKKINDATVSGWFLVVGDPSNDRILSIKRIPDFTKSISMSIQIVDANVNHTNSDIHFYLMSDSIIGMDQEYPINFAVNS